MTTNDASNPRWTQLLSMSCEHASRLTGEAHDRALWRRERVFLGLHLACCPWCRRYRRQLRLIRELVAIHVCDAERKDETVALPDEARRRIAEHLERH